MLARGIFGVMCGIKFAGTVACGIGGIIGMCATRSRQDWRSFGDICDQRSAFFKNSARSGPLMPANFA